MRMRIKFQQLNEHSLRSLWIALLIAVSLLVVGFAFAYHHYSRLIADRLEQGPFPKTSVIYSAPVRISVGDHIPVRKVIDYLQLSGYSTDPSNRLGWYRLSGNVLEVFPGPDSYFKPEAARIVFNGDRVEQIIQVSTQTPHTSYFLEPAFITNLFGEHRIKRRIVRFEEIPKTLVNAVVAVEDKRFFSHAGLDPLRILKAAYVDFKEGEIREGASTITMQLARSLWLGTERKWSRKIAEAFIAIYLEQKLSKEKIFEYYANSIYLGRRGSFDIHGFAEAAEAYLGKSIRSLTLPEAALLAGMIRAPNVYNPVRNPEAARKRRDLVLKLMLENGFISQQDYEQAVKTPLHVSHQNFEAMEAPYFVDLVKDELQQRFRGYDFEGQPYRIYTTLDPELQKAAVEAVQAGLKEVDERLKKQPRFRNGYNPKAQVALVALDPKTGAVRALVGGRDYGTSQLNRALAWRQPGSVFKPFVYAAALNTSLNDFHVYRLTPISTVVDEPTTFWFDGKPYSPGNYGNKFFGNVSLREALRHSLNVATVKVAEMVGYEEIARLARQVGLGERVEPTPAIALGAYEATPLQVAGAYTVFANYGRYLQPYWIEQIRDEHGRIIYKAQPREKPVLDTRVAYLMVNLMEDVVNQGTGAGVRRRGLTIPVAGKTGTSRDGWFAGFSSELICVVWVGFDDNRELYLEGASSALPIWTEFMKRAHQLPGYDQPKAFQPPSGVISVLIDPVTGDLAGPYCPTRQTEVFIAGTQPVELCRLHRTGHSSGTLVAGWSPVAPAAVGEPSETQQPVKPIRRVPRPTAKKPDTEPQPQAKPERKSLLQRILDIFK